MNTATTAAPYVRLKNIGALLSHQREDLARRGAARRHRRETIYDAVTPAEGVIYSLICCGNGQRIITCKILINVLQQQTSFAKLVICCSAPDSEQLN